MVDEGADFKSAVESIEPAAFVEVMFARTADEATSCCSLLEDHQIPAKIAAGNGDVRETGFPVLVPDHCLDEASELLAMRVADDDEEDDGAFGDDDDDDDDDDDFDDDLDDDDDDDDDEAVEDEP